jgi:hypothetical protein
LVDGDIDQTAAACGLPRSAVEAANTYYQANEASIDGRILLYCTPDRRAVAAFYFDSAASRRLPPR